MCIFKYTHIYLNTHMYICKCVCVRVCVKTWLKNTNTHVSKQAVDRYQLLFAWPLLSKYRCATNSAVPPVSASSWNTPHELGRSLSPCRTPGIPLATTASPIGSGPAWASSPWCRTLKQCDPEKLRPTVEATQSSCWGPVGSGQKIERLLQNYFDIFCLKNTNKCPFA